MTEHPPPRWLTVVQKLVVLMYTSIINLEMKSLHFTRSSSFFSFQIIKNTMCLWNYHFIVCSYRHFGEQISVALQHIGLIVDLKLLVICYEKLCCFARNYFFWTLTLLCVFYSRRTKYFKYQFSEQPLFMKLMYLPGTLS